MLCDGRRVVPLAPAQDFKRRRDGDAGPNTGGMGAYSPVPEVDDGLVRPSSDRAVEPLVAALRPAGDRLPGRALRRADADRRRAQVLEYNVRFGDPEAQVVLPRWPTTRSSC